MNCFVPVPTDVDRRIGGLESCLAGHKSVLGVDRRIGGLENAGI